MVKVFVGVVYSYLLPVFFTEAFYMCLLMGVWSTMESALMNETGFGSVIQAQLTFIYDDLVRKKLCSNMVISL